MNDLQKYQAPAAPALFSTAATIQLTEWAAELAAAHQIATALCQTEFVPANFRGKPEASAAAILTGKSLGIDPLNALSNIFVVQGRPAMYARTMHAIVLRAGHEVVRTAATNESVTFAARRKGSEQWQQFTWDIERAKQAGYLSNKKYTSDPIAMLTAKALAEACRIIAPDVLTGVAAYSVEEVELEDLGESPTPPAATEKPKRTVTRRKADVPAPELPAAANDGLGEIESAPTQIIPDDVITNTDKALAEGTIDQYLAWLFENNAPQHIIDYVTDRKPNA